MAPSMAAGPTTQVLMVVLPDRAPRGSPGIGGAVGGGSGTVSLYECMLPQPAGLSQTKMWTQPIFIGEAMSESLDCFLARMLQPQTMCLAMPPPCTPSSGLRTKSCQEVWLVSYVVRGVEAPFGL